MSRRCCLLLLTLFIPLPASAIQLTWNSGATDISFTATTRCTLVVQASESEGRLPSDWRLLWVADSCNISPIPLANQYTCSSDIADVASIEGPKTAADLAGNLITAHYCSSGSAPASTARFVVDLPGGSAGRFEVVAIDPSDPDSARVVQSQVVTFNGGVATPFPPVILRTTTVHHSTEFRLHAVGAGLGSMRDVSLAATDGTWRQPLTLESPTDGSVTATAQLAANVPTCIVEVSGDSGVAAAMVASDSPPPLPTIFDPPEGCETQMREVWPDHDPYLIQPKDFALVPGGWTAAGEYAFHIFYIRHNQYLLAANTEKNIGHAVSDSLSGWTVIDTAAISVRPGRFDSHNVWAPSIVRMGLTYHMFYTGVDGNLTQRIGLATSTDLVNWTQGDSVLEVTKDHPTQIPWADPEPPKYSKHPQLRDPFVVEDPYASGSWLMYFVTVAAQDSSEMVVGVARSDGDLSTWSQTYPLWNTHRSWPNPQSNPPGGPYVVESPHVFQRDGNWWLFYTVNNDSVWAEANPYAPADTLSGGSRWTTEQKLWTLVPPLQAPNFYFWHATEYLQISALNDIEFLAAYNDANVCVSITQMRPATSPYLFSMGCPSAAGVEEAATHVRSPRLTVVGVRPARFTVALRIELPSRMRANLTVYDVLGRRVRTIVDGELPAGTSELVWDGRDGGSVMVSSGVYFASLTAAGGRHSVRVPLIR